MKPRLASTGCAQARRQTTASGMGGDKEPACRETDNAEKPSRTLNQGVPVYVEALLFLICGFACSWP